MLTQINSFYWGRNIDRNRLWCKPTEIYCNFSVNASISFAKMCSSIGLMNIKKWKKQWTMIMNQGTENLVQHSLHNSEYKPFPVHWLKKKNKIKYCIHLARPEAKWKWEMLKQPSVTELSPQLFRRVVSIGTSCLGSSLLIFLQ